MGGQPALRAFEFLTAKISFPVKSMRYSSWLTATLLVSLSSGTLPAWADTTIKEGAIPHLSELETVPDITIQNTDHFLDLTHTISPITMADVLRSDPYSTANLDRLAEQMNQRLNGPSEESPFVIGGLDLSFLDNFLDEDGNLDLPLGLTVYNVMGLTSIGFGTKF
ncbi:MAG TPA: hypothetical protein IGR64_11385 [Leptolyngbyaceae cyanobacterium M65_K2018_010]|nr:hypothetical protein [Leptolyngbyaceae cyanobacterium M65_K2018_010]